MKAKFQLNDTWYVAPSKNEAEGFLRLWREPFAEVMKLKGKRVVQQVERRYICADAGQSESTHLKSFGSE
jgi:hypothetical protein